MFSLVSRDNLVYRRRTGLEAILCSSVPAGNEEHRMASRNCPSPFSSSDLGL